MTLLLSSTLLGLAWFAAVSLFASCVIWAVTRALSAQHRHLSCGTLLGLRLAPALTSALFVVLIFLPAHWRLEPRDVDEAFGSTLFLSATLAIVMLGRAARRAYAVAVSAFALRRSVRSALAEPEPGVFELSGFPGVSLAGVFRPHILIGTMTRAALTRRELEVAIAHERAHRHSSDNLKRCAMFCAPDFFGMTAVAHELEAAWRAEAECRADNAAVAGDDRKALHLAAALIKVARLGDSTRGPAGSPVWSAFHEAPLLERRVRRLIDARADRPGPPPRARRPSVALLPAIACGAWLLDIPARIHQFTELVVRVLP